MVVQKGGLLFGAIFALSMSAQSCKDWSDDLCTIVSSSRSGTIGHGRSCSGGADTLIVSVDGKFEYYHCKNRQQANLAAILQGEGIPSPPPPSGGKIMKADGPNTQSQLIARILSALGYQDKASAQSCNFNGQRLCLYIATWGQSQWYCSDQSDVYSLEVSLYGQTILSCK